MANQITTYSIDASGPNSDGSYNVVANTLCKRVLVQENYNSANPPTADLRQCMPAGGSPARIPKGTPAIYSSSQWYHPGDVIGTIRTESGSITAQQIESTQI